jgi:hypothetical protein
LDFVLVRSNNVSNLEEDVDFFAEKDVNLVFVVLADVDATLFALLDILGLRVLVLDGLGVRFRFVF